MTHVPPVQPVQDPYLPVPLERAKVSDVMRVGLVTCRPETPVSDVARMMIAYGIHSVIVAGLDEEEGERDWGVVSDLDLATAALSDRRDELTAREIASTELVTIKSDEPLERAAQLMAEHQVAHLVAVQPETGQPVGVIGTLGLARALI